MMLLSLLLIGGCTAREDGSSEQPRINISHLVRNQLQDVRHSLGTEIGGDYAYAFHRFYLFDTGLNIAVNESGNIMAATVLYRQDNQLLFHFNGIDGTATYDDVVAAFGAHPDVVREGPDERMVGAATSYGYWIGENEVVYFFFGATNELKAISFFLSEMPYSKDE